MFKLAQKLSSKAKRVILSIGTGVVAAATMAIGAFAEEPAAGTAQDLSSIVNTAGTTLKDQFIILVNTLVRSDRYCCCRSRLIRSHLSLQDG